MLVLLLRQYWDKGGAVPEEPEWFVAGAGLAAGPQPSVLPTPSGPQPEPAGGLDLPKCGLLPCQSALWLSLEL